VDTREIAAMLSAAIRGPEGPEDTGFHTGRVLTWDRVTGANTIEIAGEVFTNIRSVQSTAIGGAWYQAGDTVMVVRKQTQWFVLGKVTTTASGSSSGFQSQTTGADVTMNTSGNWVDLTGSSTLTPEVSAYTTEKGAIVIWTCTIGVDVRQDVPPFVGVANPNLEANASFAVGGASSLAAGAFSNQSTIVNLGYLNNPHANYGSNLLVTTTGIFAFGGSAGMVPGLNVFRMKFRSVNGSARFLWPGINVIPL
jgi:hypothetical protein